MKILLFGSQGMLGSQFFSDTSELFEIVPLSHFHLDLSNTEEIPECIRSFNPDIVVNTAAWTDVDGAERAHSREKVFAVNASAPEAMGKACKGLSIPFLHISTDYIFSGEKGDIFEEKSIPNPINIYGESKLLGEKLAMAANPSTWVLRTAWLFGEYGSNFIERILQTKKYNLPIPVVSDQFGSPSFAEDVIKTMIEIIENRPEFGIYHAINEGIASRFELAQKCFAFIGVPNAVKEILSEELEPSEALRPKSSALKNTKLPPLPHWEDAVERFLSPRKATLQKKF